ncbi:SRPBCC family protein [Geodermatophilus sp. SYSU D01045]
MSLRIPPSVSVEVEVGAPPEAVWAVLADPTRVGEWSGECVRAAWLPGSSAVAPGARFRGWNRSGRSRRARVCEVTEVDPGRVPAWRTVPTGPYRDRTHWRVALAPAGTGTRIGQRYDLTGMPAATERVAALLLPAHRDRTAGLRADLERLGRVAAAGQATASAPPSS